MAEECDKIEDDTKESNSQLKSQREFPKLSNDAAYFATKFSVKHHDDKKIENN